MREIGGLQSMLDHAGERLRVSGAAVPARWRQWNLTTQFTLVATIVVGISMATLGRWVADRIESGVITNTATAAALYMDRFVEPYAQDLATGQMLSPASQNALAQLVRNKSFGQHVVEVKLWRTDGTIAYSTLENMIGKRMPLSDSLARALKGEVVPEFDHLDDEENVIERGLQLPLLEIYSPIRETNTERIIAVAEFYQLAGGLASELAWARLEGVLMVGGLSLLMLGALITIVRSGGRTIASQQQALSERVADLSQSLALNEELRQRVAEANRRATEGNERFLRRVSAELHDGPVQLIGLVLLRLDGVNARNSEDAARAAETLEVIRGALKDALNEIRGLSNGLALPELESLALEDALDLAITNHERRSGTSVSVNFPGKLPPVPASIKTCAYRFVQEGLNNAFRHAGGAGQRVKVCWDGRKLTIEVGDEGPGISGTAQPSCKSGIGLTGLRDRIESLGGTMLINAVSGEGTRLRASFSLSDI
ncbi:MULTISPECIES: sensor histidine kinase [Rhodomicrobium]|uniref:sensor histidine kinase n=1 Tax=Rhodomicrobium TaxID=1068 RepID=UPI00148241B3|nr:MULTISPECIES: sensor histidine kinase [Rhodomicrobium]